MPEITIREALKIALNEAMENDEKVFIMGEDIGEYGGAYAVTDGFLKKFGSKRIKDTPISEQAFVGAGIGAAVGGLRPVIELMSISFSLVAFDQIVNMAKTNYMSGGQISGPMVIRAPTGAGVQLAATHSQSFETWLAEVPGIKVVCPSNSYDALGLMRSAIKDNNPVIFAEPALLYGSKSNIPNEYFEVNLGDANVMKEGDDITIVSYGYGSKVLSDSAKKLESIGIKPELIDLRSLNPIDYQTIIHSIQKTNRLVLVDTARKTGGIMAEISANINEKAGEWLDGPIVRVGSKDVPWPYNKNLEQEVLTDSNNILDTIKVSYGI